MAIRSIIIIILATLLAATGAKVKSVIPQPIDQLKAVHKENFNAFVEDLRTLVFHCKADVLDIDVLKRDLQLARMAYKKIEYLFAYYEPKYIELYINGPPLNKTNKERSEVGVIAPNGLQALEEILYGDPSLLSRKDVDQLSQDLLEKVIFISESHLSDSMEAFRILEAMRSGIVSIFTLGITGFDTPASGFGLREASTNLQSIQQAFNIFAKTALPSLDSISLSVNKSFDLGIEMLDNSDFDSFDRMSFLKVVINPLYKDIGIFQEKSGWPLKQITSHGQNYGVQNLFDSNFLDPYYYSEFSYRPLQNDTLVKLGKILFYDPILSRKIDMSCATCHQPSLAFTDGLPKSPTNIAGKYGKRNTPTLIDASLSTRFFWDLREYDLERQVSHVMEDELEFNFTFGEAIRRLKQSKEYLDLFTIAYGDISKEPIHRRSISNAIAAYLNSLKSFNSTFDQYVRDESKSYPLSAQRGFNLFMGKAACGTCHFPPAFNGLVPPFYIETESEVLGITLGFDTLNPILDTDPGRISNGLKHEVFPHYRNAFKTVGLRNIELTAPYMHNGSFKTLEEVLEFYNMGGGLGMGLDVPNQTLSGDPLKLTTQEMSDIIGFLHTLTDTSGLTSKIIALPQFENQPYWNKRNKPFVID